MIRIVNEVDFSGFDDNDLGGEWTINIPKDCIKGVELLPKKEYKKYKNKVPKVCGLWWLCSSGNTNNYSCSAYENDDAYSDKNVSGTNYGIRPALILNLQSLNIRNDNKFEFGGHMFTILSRELAICNDFIGKGCFRKDWKAKDSNIYERSDIKKVVDDWFNKAYAEYEG